MLSIDGIQSVGFHGDLVEVVPDVMQLPHHGEEVRGRSFLGNNTADKLPQVGGNRQVAAPCFFLEIPGFRFVQPQLDFDITIANRFHSFFSIQIQGYQGFPLTSCLCGSTKAMLAP